MKTEQQVINDNIAFQIGNSILIQIRQNAQIQMKDLQIAEMSKDRALLEQRDAEIIALREQLEEKNADIQALAEGRVLEIPASERKYDITTQ